MATTRTTYGATFSYGSPLVEVGHVEDITPPPETTNTFEVQYHDADEAEVHPSDKKTGSMTVKIGFDANDTNHMGLRTAQQNKTLTPFKVGIPGTSPAQSITFSGYVIGFAVDALPAAAKEQTATITIQPVNGTTYGA